MVRVVGGVLANPRRSAHHTIGGKGKIGPAAIFAHPQSAGVSEIVWFFLKFSLDIADNYSILKTYKLINRKDYIMDFIWNENNPIAIHVTDAEYSPASCQWLADYHDLPVRDLTNNKDYYPQ